MLTLTYLSFCIYCMLQLFYFIVAEGRYQNDQSLQKHYFILILVLMLCSFAADIVSGLNLGPDWVFPFAAIGTYIEIMLNTILLPIYFLYVCTHIQDLNPQLRKRLLTLLIILTAICCGIVLSTAFTGQIFYYDDAKIYHRGGLFALPMTIMFIMIIIIETFIISQKSKIEISHYHSLVLFLILPSVGWAFQMLIYGLPFSLISMTFAAQIVFTSIQNRRRDMDYLTNVFNRQALDNHIQSKIDSATETHSFSAILLDIDNFKSINDSFGHYEGDIALVNTAILLRNAVNRKDFIARYGGDEFCIVFKEDNPEKIKSIIDKIYIKFSNYNANTKKPYTLNVSIGFAVYHPSIGAKAELFIKTIDQNMYQEKNVRKTRIRKEQM